MAKVTQPNPNRVYILKGVYKIDSDYGNNIGVYSSIDHCLKEAKKRNFGQNDDPFYDIYLVESFSINRSWYPKPEVKWTKVEIKEQLKKEFEEQERKIEELRRENNHIDLTSPSTGKKIKVL